MSLPIHIESPWDESSESIDTHQEAEWSRISSDFTNAGYREGITSGKESSLQEGFDTGFADVGAPIGREVGLLRGLASAILGFLDKTDTADSTTPTERVEVPEEEEEARNICSQLSRIRLADIMPPDIEAEQHHARHHYSDHQDVNEEIKGKRDVEDLEDMLERMNAGTTSVQGCAVTAANTRPSLEDVQALKARLKALADATGLQIDFA